MSSLYVKTQTSNTHHSDFGESSSCCCDRGNTNLSPSPKTEVWTFDWSLTKVKEIKKFLKK